MKPSIVIWDDADGITSMWASEKEVEEFADEETLVTSVGYIYKKTKKYITLFGDLIKDKDGDTYGRVFKIPRSQVKSIK